jgi:hypothetical protein
VGSREAKAQEGKWLSSSCFSFLQVSEIPIANIFSANEEEEKLYLIKERHVVSMP